MSGDSRNRLIRAIACYFAVAIPLALFLGFLRTAVLFAQTYHPLRYLAYSVAANAGIALLPGAALFPVFLVAHRLLGRGACFAPAPAGALGAVLGVLPGFWLLTTPVGYWEPVFASPLSLAKQVGFWWGVFLVLGWVVWRFFASAGFGRCVKRGLSAAAAFLAALLVLGLVPTLAVPSGGPRLAAKPSARSRPHVFIILVDTLRPDHLSAYGYDLPTSPEVDAFAREAVFYGRSFAQAPWTRPSCASLLTSLYPPEIGTRMLWDVLPAEVPILSQFLEIEGYATAGIVSSMQISPIFGFDKGFDLFDIGSTKFGWAGLGIPLVRLGRIERSASYPRYNAGQLTDRAIRWFEDRRAEGRPLFMYLHYADPHAPYRPPEQDDRWREFVRGEGGSIPAPRDAPPLDGTILSEAEREALVARYDAEIAYFDLHFGRLIRHLKKAGLYDGSLVVFTSDHGEEFGEHDGWEHGHTLYNELLHVPLIVKYPRGVGPPAGSRLDRMVGLVDVVPTIRQLLGAEWDDSRWRGRDLLAPEAVRAVYAANDTPALRALLSDSGKLIQVYGSEDEPIDERFYLLETDFGERSGGAIPASIDSATLAEMRNLIREVESLAIPSTRADVSPETREELRALGYVE
ncbi:MAG: sulfatase [Candidatus Eisenbacteria bacterium]